MTYPNQTESRPVLHLTYHRVTPTVQTYTYALIASVFREHLKAIRDGAGSSSHRAVVTFDDGNRTQFKFAVPVLAEFGITATFFITAGWTDVNEGSMSARELSQLAKAGHKIGSHGLTHKLLTHCSTAELHEELTGSKQRIEDSIGQAITVISMPGGRYDDRVLEACAMAGYSEVFTSDPVTEVREIYGLRVIGRYNVRNTLSVEALIRLLDPSSGELRREHRRARIKQLGQNIVGDELYHRLWSLMARAKRST